MYFYRVVYLPGLTTHTVVVIRPRKNQITVIHALPQDLIHLYVDHLFLGAICHKAVLQNWTSLNLLMV